MEATQLNILSIDAWREPEGGYTWNAWYTVGAVSKDDFEKLDTNRKLLRYMRDEGYINQGVRVLVEDDQYNIVFCERNGRPVYAIEYGPAYN